ncbi:type II toxin-antitoxin system RelE/ParE family toxin, partial [Fusobacterium varium]|uniref:type II toxin-antitoxin system YafQ family toxin n=1 Tax=Fusobacterium varium TaxID=856 RepID=UPI0001AFF481
MLDIVTTKVFDKDYKLLKKRGYNLNLIKEVIEMLADENIKKISQNELKSVLY